MVHHRFGKVILLLTDENGGEPIRPNIAATAINSDKIVAVWEELGYPLKYKLYDFWNESWSGTPGELPDLPGSPDRNPVVASVDNHAWEVYVRLGGQIQHMTWISPTLTTPWEPLPGLIEEASAASDPAVITTGPQHTLVFYRDTNGAIRFTERQNGVWRARPLALLGQENHVFLPLIGQAMTTNAASGQFVPKIKLAPADPLTADLSSELSAASRNENHASVFYVDEQNRLWVNEWTHLNNSDWSDTSWQMLMEDVMIEKPAVASRHVNHLAVAVRDTSGLAYQIEWTPDLNHTGQPGWKAPYSLGKISEEPLALAAASVDNLAVFGYDSGWWQKSWTGNVGWGEWVSIGTFTSTLTAVVVSRPNDMMLLGWTQRGDGFGQVVSKHFTSQGKTPTETEIVPAGETKGYPRGQTLARVGGKTLWVTAHEEDSPSPQYWQVDALDLGEDTPPEKLVLQEGDHLWSGNHADVFTAAADLDFDGDEEAVVATLYPANPIDNGSMSLSALNFEINPTLAISTLATNVITPTTGITRNFSLALGDLDGDGMQNELILARTIYNYDLIELSVYQYDPLSQALALKAKETLDLIFNPGFTQHFHAQVQVDTGMLYPGSPGQQIVVSDLVLYLYGSLYWVLPSVRTYSVDTSQAEWEIEPVDDQLITPEVAVMAAMGPSSYFPEQILGSYSSALDTGDLDADGYDEIALAYSYRVLFVDPVHDGSWRWFDTIDYPVPETLISPVRSLAIGDTDLNGRAEVFSEMVMNYVPDYVPQLNQFEIRLNESGIDTKLTSTINLPTISEGGRLNAILMGDIDNNSFMARLTGCGEIGDAKIVAVLNGAPRWYASGKPINESRGTYSVLGDSTSSEETGTKFNLGASLSVGYEQEFNVPIIGTKIGEARASVTTDFMSSQGLRQSSEEYESWGLGLGFESLSLGEVVYEYVSNTCYFYDVFRWDSPGDTSKAMACIPAPQDDVKTRATGLENWRTQAVKDAAGFSWANVGHRTPNGSYSNDLGIAGNYRPVLPVDDYMLVYQFQPVTIKNDDPGQFVEWSYETGTGGARTQFNEMDLNVTVSAGVTLFGFSTDRSLTTGRGTESSQRMAWGESLAFYGRSYHFQDPGRLCYTVVPYVYQAKARTLAGVTYPYWEMDYYVTKIWPCTLKTTSTP